MKPQAWSGFGVGHFNLKGKLPPVPGNARLVKGLFNESLPAFLAELDATNRQSPAVLRNVTFLHIDCDLVQSLATALCSGLMNCLGFHCRSACQISHTRCHTIVLLRLLTELSCSLSGSVQYAGARDALALLSDRIHPGAVLVFDDLLAYPSYR